MRCLPIVHPFHEAKIRGGQPLCPLMLSAMFENGRPCGQTSVRTGDRRPVYPRKVTVSATSMTKHQLLVKSHVRHEAFVREFQPIVNLWMTYSLFKACVLDPTTHEGSQDPQSRGGKVRAAVGLLKELVDRLEALLEEWPNAVWFFFPVTGHAGRIRLWREFYTEVYPVWFPEAPRVPCSHRRLIRGHRRCGISKRIRKEIRRTFHMWDQFKAGHRPMEIARRAFPSQSSQQTRTWKKELMVVHRSLDRASQLIYEQPLPNRRKIRRLLGFNIDDHVTTCAPCRNATAVDKMCPTGRDFVDQDSKS